MCIFTQAPLRRQAHIHQHLQQFAASDNGNANKNDAKSWK
jgi:hypothetical protein